MGDDHAVVRDGLRTILEASGGIACLQADTAEAALELLDQKVPVDVVLLDITLPGMSGFDALGEIHSRRQRSHLSLTKHCGAGGARRQSGRHPPLP